MSDSTHESIRKMAIKELERRVAEENARYDPRNDSDVLFALSSLPAEMQNLFWDISLKRTQDSLISRKELDLKDIETMKKSSASKPITELSDIAASASVFEKMRTLKYSNAEILFLDWLDGKPASSLDIPSYWSARYGIRTKTCVGLFLASGHLSYSDIQFSLNKTTVKQLKELLSEGGLPLSGRKPELVNRLLSRCPADFLNSRVPKWLSVTASGKELIAPVLYLKYFKDRYSTLGIELDTAAAVKSSNPNLNEFQIARWILADQGDAACEKKQYGLYRNCLFCIATTFDDEKASSRAAHYFLMASFIDAAGYNNNGKVEKRIACLAPSVVQWLRSYYKEDKDSFVLDLRSAIDDLPLPEKWSYAKSVRHKLGVAIFVV